MARSPPAYVPIPSARAYKKVGLAHEGKSASPKDNPQGALGALLSGAFFSFCGHPLSALIMLREADYLFASRLFFDFFVSIRRRLTLLTPGGDPSVAGSAGWRSLRFKH
jgi:hypothetical protein